MQILITNIGKLYQIWEEAPSGPLRGSELGRVPFIENAYLLIQQDRVVDYGPMHQLASHPIAMTIDAGGRHVMPTWVDAHTHLVFAATREEEFVMKIEGKSYEEIAAAGGGILNSARRLTETDEEALFEAAYERVVQLISMGTGALEIKSGYGLDVEAELKMLRVIRRLDEAFPIPIQATFLGAHAYPAAYRNNHEGYIRQIVEEMLPAIAAEGLADYVDVFCDRGFFSPEETAQILEAARRYGLRPRIHANELGHTGGVEVAVRYGAVSVDHLEYLNDEEMALLRGSSTIPILLPGTAFFLNLPYPPARRMIEADLPVAIATDFNPGSSPSGNMAFMMSLATIKMKMTPEEAYNALTINPAVSMNIHSTHGHLRRGGPANFIITRPMRDLSSIAYHYAMPMVEAVFIEGKIWKADNSIAAQCTAPACRQYPRSALFHPLGEK